MRSHFVFVLLCLFLCAGCQTTSAFIPKANRSTYFATRSAGFLMDVASNSVQSSYYLSLKILKPLDKDGYLEVEFEDTMNEAQSIIVGNTLKAQQEFVDIQSPEVEGIKKLALYDVQIRLYDDANKQSLLGTHKQKVSALHSEETIQKLSKN